MGAPVGGQELVERQVSSTAGRPPNRWFAHARFVLAIALIAAGCALLVASYAPRPATAQWVGTGLHDASLLFLSPRETTTDSNA